MSLLCDVCSWVLVTLIVPDVMYTTMTEPFGAWVLGKVKASVLESVFGYVYAAWLVGLHPHVSIEACAGVRPRGRY